MGLILNPSLLVGLVPVLNRVHASMLGCIYPWAFSVEGLSRIWLGDLTIQHSAKAQGLIRITTVIATAMGYLGVLKAWLDRLYAGGLSRDDKRVHYQFSCVSCVLALCLLPLLVIAKDSEHAYQYYKLFLTISPLLVLGIALFWQRPVPPTTVRIKWYPAVPVQISLSLVLIGAIIGTGRLAWRAGHAKAQARSSASLLLTPDIRQLQERLRKLPASDLVQALNEPFLNSWSSYFARNHRVWLCCPDITNFRLKEDLPANTEPQSIRLDSGDCVTILPGQGTLNVKDLPDHVVILWEKAQIFQTVSPGDLSGVWSGGSFRLSQSVSNGWAVPVGVDAYLEQYDGKSLFWMGEKPVTLEVLAGTSGLVTIEGTVISGPALPETAKRRLNVCTDSGEGFEITTEGGRVGFSVLVPKGKSRIRLACLDQPTRPAPNGDPRVLMLRVQDLTFGFKAKHRVPDSYQEPGLHSESNSLSLRTAALASHHYHTRSGQQPEAE
jgi:hypothetical protein